MMVKKFVVSYLKNSWKHVVNSITEREMQLARKDKEELRLLKKEEKEKEKARKKQSQQIKALSFNMLDDEEEEVTNFLEPAVFYHLAVLI